LTKKSEEFPSLFLCPVLSTFKKQSKNPFFGILFANQIYMNEILRLKQQIIELNCDKELGWLQLRLLVLNLLNAMVPLAYEKREVSIAQVKELQSFYQQYLQVPFSSINDGLLCTSVKNEVLRYLNALQSQSSLQAA
jgi:hypothetical protein